MTNWSQRIWETREGMILALDAVRANKFRSLMTIIGVMVGVGAVILVNTIMDGFTAYAESSIDKIGSNVMYIIQYDEGTDWENMTEEERRRKDITMDEAYAIQEMCPLVEAVGPQKRAQNNIAKYNNRSIRTPDDFRGCWPTQMIVTNREVSHGRFFDDNDMQREAMVCVIGPEIADALFDTHEEAVGKVIRINGWNFTVLGVQARVDDFFGISENDFIFIPMTTFDRLYPNEKSVTLMCSAVSRMQFGEAMDQVINALRRVRKVRPDEPNNFGILTQDRFKDEVAGITSKVQLGATAVACVGLMVGVIGVMNIMLVAVTQRTREIGVRKAVGARKHNIMFQFLVEAATLTMMGGLIGIIFGAGLGWLVTTLLEWKYFFSPAWAIIGLVLSAGTGIVSGLYPAWRAARTDPIVALRYE
ncbi:MAG: ABC transporter permease [bacterium]|nr:ABC transporter permease [bacterium]